MTKSMPLPNPSKTLPRVSMSTLSLTSSSHRKPSRVLRASLSSRKMGCVSSSRLAGVSHGRPVICAKVVNRLVGLA